MDYAIGWRKLLELLTIKISYLYSSRYLDNFDNFYSTSPSEESSNSVYCFKVQTFFFKIRFKKNTIRFLSLSFYGNIFFIVAGQKQIIILNLFLFAGSTSNQAKTKGLAKDFGYHLHFYHFVSLLL